MEIVFNEPNEIVLIPQQKITVSKITILQIADLPNRKIVRAHTRELGVVILWEGTNYDTIGQWTDTDVINRLNELYA